jgi:hypothetical protein
VNGSVDILALSAGVVAIALGVWLLSGAAIPFRALGAALLAAPGAVLLVSGLARRT